MKRNFFKVLVISAFAFCFVFTSLSFAAPKEGMSHGNFAFWLVKAVGAMYKLPPGASEQDAFDFLAKLGMVPKDGWKEDGVINKDTLLSLLDLSEQKKAELINDPNSFDKLVDEVRKLLESRFNATREGVFRVSSASGSVPA